MEELRWLLLILGLLVIVLVYGYGRVQEWRDEGPPWRRRRRVKDGSFADDVLSDEDIEGTLSELDTLISEHQGEVHGLQPAPAATADNQSAAQATRGNNRTEVPAPTVSHPSERREGPLASLLGSRAKAPEPKAEREPEREPKNRGEEKIVVINLVASPEGGRFSGPELVRALEAAGLHYGEHQIFHCLPGMDTGSGALFSVVNILEPGWFDLERIAGFDTPGVAFFMRLPSPYDGLDTFEQMLATARMVAERIGGHLLDGRHCDLTQQSIKHIREDLMEYRRRVHLAARQAR